METFDFWQELKKAGTLIVNHPQIILVTLIPSLRIAISNYLTWKDIWPGFPFFSRKQVV